MSVEDSLYRIRMELTKTFSKLNYDKLNRLPNLEAYSTLQSRTEIQTTNFKNCLTENM